MTQNCRESRKLPMKSWASLWRDCTVLMKSRGVMPSRPLEIWLWGNWLTLLFCISSPVLLRCLRFHRLHCLPSRYLLGLSPSSKFLRPKKGRTLRKLHEPLKGRWWQEPVRKAPSWRWTASSPRRTPMPKTCLLPTSLPSRKQPPLSKRGDSSGCNPGLFLNAATPFLSHPHTMALRGIPKLGLVVVFNGF